MVTVVHLHAHNHYFICNDNHILYLSKTLVQLVLENIICNSGTKCHDSVPESAKFCIKSCQAWWGFIKLLMPVSFSTVTDCHNACICNQMGKAFWGFEMVRFPDDSLVYICWILADPKLEIAWLILAFYKNKAINPWCGFLYMFKHFPPVTFCWLPAETGIGW